MIKAMAKNMTTDELAIMLQGEFKVIHAEFRDVHSEMDRMNQRLARIEFNTSGQDSRIATLEDKVRIISTKLGLDTRTA